jgi:hypothetical protein
VLWWGGAVLRVVRGVWWLLTLSCWTVRGFGAQVWRVSRCFLPFTLAMCDNVGFDTIRGQYRSIPVFCTEMPNRLSKYAVTTDLREPSTFQREHQQGGRGKTRSFTRDLLLTNGSSPAFGCIEIRGQRADESRCFWRRERIP